MKKILSLITLISMSACAYASNWQRYDSIYVDNQSLAKTENSVQGWIISPQFEKSQAINKHYIYEASLVDARCSSKEMATLSTAWYNKWHKWEEHAVNDISYVEIKPKTNNEVIFRTMCSRVKI